MKPHSTAPQLPLGASRQQFADRGREMALAKGGMTSVRATGLVAGSRSAGCFLRAFVLSATGRRLQVWLRNNKRLAFGSGA
jgi:hypothetical protein